jgi:alkanesulfonate monooxygenase SsuD/methylene tetrahydromethanopterin reductase-like flavin-dependent oxidoreductase (luciferase family)
LDHVSKGRLIFGVGRSGVVKTYEALNIAYSESKDREIGLVGEIVFPPRAHDFQTLEDQFPAMPIGAGPFVSRGTVELSAREADSIFKLPAVAP